VTFEAIKCFKLGSEAALTFGFGSAHTFQLNRKCVLIITEAVICKRTNLNDMMHFLHVHTHTHTGPGRFQHVASRRSQLQREVRGGLARNYSFNFLEVRALGRGGGGAACVHVCVRCLCVCVCDIGRGGGEIA
jgi:hypothetical protein